MRCQGGTQKQSSRYRIVAQKHGALTPRIQSTGERTRQLSAGPACRPTERGRWTDNVCRCRIPTGRFRFPGQSLERKSDLNVLPGSAA